MSDNWKTCPYICGSNMPYAARGCGARCSYTHAGHGHHAFSHANGCDAERKQNANVARERGTVCDSTYSPRKVAP